MLRNIGEVLPRKPRSAFLRESTQNQRSYVRLKPTSILAFSHRIPPTETYDRMRATHGAARYRHRLLCIFRQEGGSQECDPSAIPCSFLGSWAEDNPRM